LTIAKQQMVNEWNSLLSTSACNRGFDGEHVQEQTGQVLARYEQ